MACDLECSILLNSFLSVACRGRREAGPELGPVVHRSSITALCAGGSSTSEHSACDGDPVGLMGTQLQLLFLFLLSLHLKPFGRCPVKVVLSGTPAKIAGNPVIFSKVKLPRCEGGSLPAPLFPESIYPSVRHIPGNQRTFVDSQTD